MLRLLGADAVLGVFSGNMIPRHEPLDPALLRGADRNGHIAQLSQPALEQRDGINGGEGGIFRQSADNFRPDRTMGDGVQIQERLLVRKDDGA